VKIKKTYSNPFYQEKKIEVLRSTGAELHKIGE
jgi:hypothetical protein